MAASMRSEMHLEIDTIELKRSADLMEEAHRAYVDAEARRARLEQRLPKLLWLGERGTDMAEQSRHAVASSWRLLWELGEGAQSIELRRRAHPAE